MSLMAHEMGHALGLRHSNNWDEDTDPYDNSWDIMSDAWSWMDSDPGYGLSAKHPIAYHKAALGWISSDEIFEAEPDSIVSIGIDHLALAETTNYRMAVIPIPGTLRYYSVEVRDLVGNYDGFLPGNAVIIHEVDDLRLEPAWAIDGSAIPGDTSAGEGTMWRVGETFSDPDHSITISIDSQTPGGFELTLTTGSGGGIFTDDFESGDTSTWSTSVS